MHRFVVLVLAFVAVSDASGLSSIHNPTGLETTHLRSSLGYNYNGLPSYYGFGYGNGYSFPHLAGYSAPYGSAYGVPYTGYGYRHGFDYGHGYGYGLNRAFL